MMMNRDKIHIYIYARQIFFTQSYQSQEFVVVLVVLVHFLCSSKNYYFLNIHIHVLNYE